MAEIDDPTYLFSAARSGKRAVNGEEISGIVELDAFLTIQTLSRDRAYEQLT